MCTHESEHAHTHTHPARRRNRLAWLFKGIGMSCALCVKWSVRRIYVFTLGSVLTDGPLGTWTLQKQDKRQKDSVPNQQPRCFFCACALTTPKRTHTLMASRTPNPWLCPGSDRIWPVSVQWRCNVNENAINPLPPQSDLHRNMQPQQCPNAHYDYLCAHSIKWSHSEKRCLIGVIFTCRTHLLSWFTHRCM